MEVFKRRSKISLREPVQDCRADGNSDTFESTTKQVTAKSVLWGFQSSAMSGRMRWTNFSFESLDLMTLMSVPLNEHSNDGLGWKVLLHASHFCRCICWWPSICITEKVSSADWVSHKTWCQNFIGGRSALRRQSNNIRLAIKTGQTSLILFVLHFALPILLLCCLTLSL